MQKKSTVTADLKKNRLLVTLRGRVSKKDLQEIYTEIRFCVADLQSGFITITDFTDCKIGYLSGLGTFVKIREYLQDKGIGKSVRIGGKGQLIFHQLSKITDKSANYPIIYVSTKDEAEQALTASETS